MNLTTCITNLVTAGELTPERAAEVQDIVRRTEQSLINVKGLSPEAAARESQNLGLQMARAAVDLDLYQKSLQVIALDQGIRNVRAHPEGVTTGVYSLLGRDLTRKATYANVDMRSRTVLNELHRRFVEPMDALRSKALGLTQDIQTARDMVLELHGTRTGNADAAAFAKIWSDVAEYARTRFNLAGGGIAKRSDWGMPHVHDARRVRKVSKDDWKAYITPLLDRSKMLDDVGLPISPADLDRLLDKAYDRIVTNGLIDLSPADAGVSQGKKLGNRHQEHRYLAFKDGQSWLDYNDRFGEPDIFHSMTGHLDGMAHDIALMEILGPNPDLTYRALRTMARQGGLEGLNLATLDALYNVVARKADDTASVFWADIGSGLRNWVSAARLGGAALSSLSDISFVQQTALWTGMNGLSVFRREVANLASHERRKVGVLMGLGAEAWVTRALAANRFTEITGNGISAKVADFVMRASGLSAMTDANKKAFGMELFAFFAEHRRTPFSDLPAPFRAELDRHGFTAVDWRDLGQTPTLSYEGVHFLSMDNLMKRTDLPEARKVDLANKVGDMQAELSLFAVPEPDARARAITTAGKARGTPAGEAVRFMMQFKSFPVSVILSHMYRGAYMESTGTKLGYLASLIVGTTALGVVAMQAKELAKGRDPRPMFDDPRQFANALGAGFLQGGGAGIYGDFLYTSLFGVNQYGRGIVDTAMGPIPSLLLNDLPQLTTGSLGKLYEGRDPKFLAKLIRLVHENTPGQSLWYTRLAVDRAVETLLLQMADPQAAAASARRQVKARRTEYDQGYWWAPYQPLPQRAPEIGG